MRIRAHFAFTLALGLASYLSHCGKPSVDVAACWAMLAVANDLVQKGAGSAESRETFQLGVLLEAERCFAGGGAE